MSDFPSVLPGKKCRDKHIGSGNHKNPLLPTQFGLAGQVDWGTKLRVVAGVTGGRSCVIQPQGYVKTINTGQMTG